MADLKSEDHKFDSITLGDTKVRVFGDTAIVTRSLDAKSTHKGKFQSPSACNSKIADSQLGEAYWLNITKPGVADTRDRPKRVYPRPLAWRERRWEALMFIPRLLVFALLFSV